ncbi:hypothetical protein PMI15_00019 [Polaromonas sp. CF318]|uniref:hypothetical protein n=1 Tax=Polaromonas sp. CF318 TaxID=1144318 RepID=UPI000270DABC|nr:hypothetical protein [Polaromonas sp. CF318]EJL91724.1 hypothetical protein PMI15_00019 [Polaromonas sp. CF318]
MNHAQAPGARLQQQPQRFMDRQQQQSSGSREFQPHRPQPFDVPASQMGGGERQYQDAIHRNGIKS